MGVKKDKELKRELTGFSFQKKITKRYRELQKLETLNQRILGGKEEEAGNWKNGRSGMIAGKGIRYLEEGNQEKIQERKVQVMEEGIRGRKKGVK